MNTKNIKVLIMLTLLQICFFVWTETCEVEYLASIVEMKEGKDWVELNIGDKIDSDAVLRVSKGGNLQLVMENRNIIINKDGTYNLKDIVKASKQVSSWGLGSALKAKLSALTGDQKADDDAAQLGVMATEAGARPADFTGIRIGSVDMVDFDTYMQYGRANIVCESYELAVTYFNEARDLAVYDQEINEASYYLARAYLETGKYVLAYNELMGKEIAPAVSYYPGYVIVLGNLYLLNSSFEAARSLFQEYFTDIKDKDKVPKDNQTISFLASIAYRGLNNLPKAKEFLVKARDIDPKSDIGLAAVQMLAELK